MDTRRQGWPLRLVGSSGQKLAFTASQLEMCLHWSVRGNQRVLPQDTTTPLNNPKPDFLTHGKLVGTRF